LDASGRLSLTIVTCSSTGSIESVSNAGVSALISPRRKIHCRLRRIFPTDGEGKCAVQHSVSLSQ
jgi:hypothetical protein